MSEIESIVKFNLLWHPFILIRHIDLFDNLAFARFMTSTAAQELSEAKLLRVASPCSMSFRELFEQWFFGSGAGQHLHHLNPKEQHVLDEASRHGKIRNLSEVEGLIKLDRYGLNLSDLLARYEQLFNAGGLLVSPLNNLPKDWYSKRVYELWEGYINFRNQYQPVARGVARLEILLKQGREEGWRRRDYYTRLEEIETTGHRKLIADIKVLVVNAAFYDEFEQFRVDDVRTIGRISAVRDLTLVRRPPPVDVFGRPPQESRCSAKLVPLDQLSISDIVSFHKGETSEAREFLKSIRNLHRLEMAGRACMEEGEVEKAVAEHIENLNACVRRSFRDKGLPSPTEDSWTEVFLNVNPDVAASSAAEALVGLARTIGIPHMIPEQAIVWSLHRFFSILLTRIKTRTYEWNDFYQAVLKPAIENELRHD